MYDTALFELQTAIYERLSTDTALSALVTGVFDAVPEDQPYPYVVIGEPSVLPFESKNTFGEQIDLVIHAWSEYAGKKEAYDMLSACQKALAYRLNVTGFRIEKVERKGINVFDDIDPRLRHGVLRMRFFINN